MLYTNAQAWLDAHELIECKPLKGRWDSENMSGDIQAGQTAAEKCQSSDQCGGVQERALCELSDPCGFRKSRIALSQGFVEARKQTARLP